MTNSIEELTRIAYELKTEENEIYRRLLECDGLIVSDDELDYSIPFNDLEFYINNKREEIMELHLLAMEYYLDSIQYEIIEIKSTLKNVELKVDKSIGMLERSLYPLKNINIHKLKNHIKQKLGF